MVKKKQSELDIEIEVTRKLKEKIDNILDEALTDLLAEKRKALKEDLGWGGK